MGVVFLKDGHDKPSLTQRTMGEEEDVSAEIEDELGEADDEHSLEQQLVQDFEVQLNAEQTSQDAALSSPDCARGRGSRVHRMRAEYAAWGGSVATEQLEECEEDEEALAFEA